MQQDHREDPALEQRQRIFARVASGILWAFTIGFAVCAVQAGRALRTDKVWTNYKGEIVTAAEMRHSFIFFLSATVVCFLLAFCWRRFGRRR
jgi:hypothetical protein